MNLRPIQEEQIKQEGRSEAKAEIVEMLEKEKAQYSSVVSHVINNAIAKIKEMP